jgi:uncharacterized damage-inducible protein DinB
MQSIDQFLEHFQLQHHATRTLIAAIPEAHFAWRPSPPHFSLGEIVVHMIQAELFWRRMILMSVKGEAYDPFKLSGSGEERLRGYRPSNVQDAQTTRFGTTFAECLESWGKIHAKTCNEFKVIPPEALQTVSVDHPLLAHRGKLWSFLMLMIEHEVHHRGQLSGYMKLLEVDQPASITG